MAQIITKAVAGSFRATYIGPAAVKPTTISLGVIGARGIRLIHRFEGEEYGGDVLGNSVIEGVYLGGQMFLEFELEEANNAGVLALCNPYATIIDTPTTDLTNEVGIPGTFMTAKAGSLLLNPLFSATGNVGTTAGGQTTPVLTFGLVTIAAGFEMEKLMSSKRKVIPIRLRCFPYSDEATPAKYIWFSRAALDATYRVI